MKDPEASQYHSRAAYGLALVQSGRSPDEADKIVKRKWAIFQDQVRKRDPSEYPSLDHYLMTLVYAELPTEEIGRLVTRAKERWEEQQAREREQREARDRYERQVEEEEVRMEAAYESLRRRLHLDLEDDSEFLEGTAGQQRLDEVRARYAGWQNVGYTSGSEQEVMDRDPLYDGFNGNGRPLR